MWDNCRLNLFFDILNLTNKNMIGHANFCMLKILLTIKNCVLLIPGAGKITVSVSVLCGQLVFKV